MAAAFMPMPPPRIRTFSVHCREQYGYPVGKIPLDLGLRCPNRDRGGCLYCRPASFTPFSLRTEDPLAEQILRGKRYLVRNRFRRYFAYFQQETPTILATNRLMPRVATVLDDPDCLGLIISTRPDYIAADLPEALAELVRRSGKECLVELGLQSIHAKSLRFLNRNHGFGDFTDAVRRLRAAGGIAVGAHLILGIPGETEAEMLATVRTVGLSGVDALKLHHLQIIRDTPLAPLYASGQIEVYGLEPYLELLLHLLPHIPWKVCIHRLCSTAHPHLLVAPRWNCLTGELSRRLQELMVKRDIRQGERC